MFGFPTETEADMQMTVDVVRRVPVACRLPVGSDSVSQTELLKWPCA